MSLDTGCDDCGHRTHDPFDGCDECGCPEADEIDFAEEALRQRPKHLPAWGGVTQ